MPLAREYDYISYSEYLEYTKNLEQKTEYSDGEIFYMSPIHPKHNKVQNRLYMQLENSKRVTSSLSRTPGGFKNFQWQAYVKA